MNLYERVALNVKRLRTGKGWTQEVLRARLKASTSTVPMIENGKRGVSLNMLDRLAYVFRVDPVELVRKP